MLLLHIIIGIQAVIMLTYAAIGFVGGVISLLFDFCKWLVRKVA